MRWKSKRRFPAGNVQIGPATSDLLKSFISENTNPRESGRFGKTDSGYSFERLAPEKAAALAVRAQHLLDICEVAPVLGLAQMDSKQRKMLVHLHGQAGAEAQAASIEDGFFCWADDETILYTADAYGGQIGSAQSVFDAVAARGATSQRRRCELTAGLLTMGYAAVWFSPNVTVVAAELADYDPTSAPFCRIVDLLSQNNRHPIHIMSSAVVCIYEVAQNLALDASRASAISLILERISQRENGRLLVEQILRMIPARFGLSALRGYEAEQTIKAWLSQNSL